MVFLFLALSDILFSGSQQLSIISRGLRKEHFCEIRKLKWLEGCRFKSFFSSSSFFSSVAHLVSMGQNYSATLVQGY